MRIEVGCGATAHPGFVGLDRFALPGVAVVGDLDRPPLPFRDDCADLILASHSLEHVRELLPVLEELWRIARPGAQLVIVAPYGLTLLNLANPYHLQHFNEHSPRFWTAASQTPVDPREFLLPPHGSAWGLLHSDNTRSRLDLRCLRMEFLYLDPYRNLPAWLQRRLRKTRLDVCGQILYHLLVVKPPMDEALVAAATRDFRPFFPPRIESQRGPRRLGRGARLRTLLRAVRLTLAG